MLVGSTHSTTQTLDITIENVGPSIPGFSDYDVVEIGLDTIVYLGSTDGKLYKNINKMGWEPEVINGYTLEAINAIDVLSDGTIYIATTSNGILYGKDGDYNQYDSTVGELRFDHYLDILVDNDNVLWTLDRDQRLYTLKDGAWRDHSIEPEGSSFEYIGIFLDSYNDVWAYTSEGFDEFFTIDDYDRGLFTFTGAGIVYSFYENGDDGFIWVPSSRGLIRVIKDNNSPTLITASTDNMQTSLVTTDNEGLYWCVLKDGGLSIFNLPDLENQIYTVDDYPAIQNIIGTWSLGDEYVYMIADDSGDLLKIKKGISNTANVFTDDAPYLISTLTHTYLEFANVSRSGLQYQILDRQGKLFASKDLPDNNQVAIEALLPGTYFISISIPGEKIKATFSFIKP